MGTRRTNAGRVIPVRTTRRRTTEPKGRETERTKTQQPYGLIHRDRMRIETHTESETTEPKGRIKTRRNRNQDDVRSTRVGSRRITGHNKRRYKTKERRIENHTQLERIEAERRRIRNGKTNKDAATVRSHTPRPQAHQNVDRIEDDEQTKPKRRENSNETKVLYDLQGWQSHTHGNANIKKELQ